MTTSDSGPSESYGPLDQTDTGLIRALRDRPRATIADLSRSLGIARNTVLARKARLEERRVITGYGPDVAARPAGYHVLAFVTLVISQGAHTKVVEELRKVPEVLEIHTITGAGDLLIRLVAETNDHLHYRIQSISAIPEIERVQTQLALHTPLERTVADLIAERHG